jgi:probable F420-dependent oxidoreductase
MSVKVGVSLGFLNPAVWPSLTVAADDLGFESVWLPEHLVLPVRMSGSPRDDGHPPIPPEIPLYDAWAYLSFLAGRTSSVRLGTYVYLLGLRHPFVSARAIATLDLVSGGRAEVGVGSGWLREEWDAVGLPFESRGRRLEEALHVCRRLWAEREVEHHGEFYGFDKVMFEPKPVQQPGPRVHVGGVSEVALRRAARLGDGWMGMNTTPEEARGHVERLQALGAGPSFEFTVLGAAETRADLARWGDAGVTRLLLNNLGRSRDAVDTLRRRAEQLVG